MICLLCGALGDGMVGEGGWFDVGVGDDGGLYGVGFAGRRGGMRGMEGREVDGRGGMGMVGASELCQLGIK